MLSLTPSISIYYVTADTVLWFFQAWPPYETIPYIKHTHKHGVCESGHQFCFIPFEIQVTSCPPKCHFLSAPVTHTHKQTHTLTHTLVLLWAAMSISAVKFPPQLKCNKITDHNRHKHTFTHSLLAVSCWLSCRVVSSFDSFHFEN